MMLSMFGEGDVGCVEYGEVGVSGCGIEEEGASFVGDKAREAVGCLCRNGFNECIVWVVWCDRWGGAVANCVPVFGVEGVCGAWGSFRATG